MVAPHVHRSPSDLRYRVHDGEKFVAIFEPDEQHLAEEALQRLLPKRKARGLIAPPRELVLEVTEAPVHRGAPTVEDSERVHVQKFSDGFRVWHPDLRTFVAGPDGAYPRREDALARARDVMVQIGASAKARKPSRAARPAPSEGGLFAPREIATKGEQIGFKFNGARRGPRQHRTDKEIHDEQERGIRALTRLGRAVIEEPDAFDAELAEAARQADLVLLVDLIAYREANALRETKTRGGYTEWSRVIGGYGPFKDLWRGAAVANLQSALRHGTLIPSDAARKSNGAQQPWGRRFAAPTLGLYEDTMPIGRHADAEDLRVRTARRPSIEQYERGRELKPNGVDVFQPSVVSAKTTASRVRGVEFRRRFLLVRLGQASAWIEVSPQSLMIGFVAAPTARAEVHGADPNMTVASAHRALQLYVARRPGGSAW